MVSVDISLPNLVKTLNGLFTLLHLEDTCCLNARCLSIVTPKSSTESFTEKLTDGQCCIGWYYLSMDANYPTDTPSQAENNVNTAIKNFEQWNFKNAFKLYFPPRNKLCYKRKTLVKRLSVWFDHIMMSIMMLWQFWKRQISSNRKRRRRKIFYSVPLWQSRVSHQVALENPRPHNCCDPLALVYCDLIFFTLKMILIKTDTDTE